MARKKYETTVFIDNGDRDFTVTFVADEAALEKLQSDMNANREYDFVNLRDVSGAFFTFKKEHVLSLTSRLLDKEAASPDKQQQ